MTRSRPLGEDPELEFLASSTLTRRKDYLGVEEEAKQAPNRMLYYRKNADVDRLIQVCSEKLELTPQNFRALYLRASSFAKKGNLRFMSLTPQSMAFVVLLLCQPASLCFQLKIRYASLSIHLGKQGSINGHSAILKCA